MLPLTALASAAAHRLGSKDAELLLQYGPRQGYRAFRRALASFLTERYGTAVDAEHLMVTAGVSHGLDLAVGALARPGDTIVVECPTYFLVTPIFRDNHLTVVPMPTDANGLVVEELERWLRADASNRPRLLYTVPIHNNPRGTTLPPERRAALLRLAAEFDFTVLADEVYQLLSFPNADAAHDQLQHRRHEHQHPPTEAEAANSSPPAAVPPLPRPLRCYEAEGTDPRDSRVVSFGSFSKMLAPALRLGWLESSNPELLRRCRENGVISSGGCIAQMSAGTGASSVGVQGLAHSALELGLQDSHLDGVVRPGLAARCAALVAGLRRHLPPGACEGLMEPRGGYFVWLQLPAQVDSTELLALAERSHGVRFTPGPACGGGGHSCVRLSFAFYSEQELEEGARRLAAAVREYLEELGAGKQPGAQQRQQ
ncbi:hypothetical protein GPECTOR_42g846 [Gonium pectorale]|uniref:Aminotransferase class I/classII large domain-containing protein n=1 Tax=Gonium pectorale TaxID=33097 RepID=A0A150GAP0_GONPE|nr:hypothetical protein GPECTOR_42g846 [Gonium pectorale]|eukprot:KXZ46635.1 hypothetical protein GPECTOR_42g846 [Gonium pectorale]